MSWSETVKKYYADTKQTFKLPKKGSEDYKKIRAIYDGIEKPPKAPRVKKEKAPKAPKVAKEPKTAKKNLKM